MYDKTQTASSIERVKGQYDQGVKAATHALRDGHEADEDEREDAAAVPARSGEERPSDPSHERITSFLALSESVYILLSIYFFIYRCLYRAVFLSHPTSLSLAFSLYHCGSYLFLSLPSP